MTGQEKCRIIKGEGGGGKRMSKFMRYERDHAV